jgi:hypothetical protein
VRGSLRKQGRTGKQENGKSSDKSVHRHLEQLADSRGLLIKPILAASLSTVAK